MKLFIAILCGRERTGWICPELAEWCFDGRTPEGVDATISLVCGYWPVDFARNVAVERARKAGADWLLMVDNDNVPHPETLARIALANDRGLDVLGFACPILTDAGLCPNVQAGEVADAKSDAEFEEIPELGSACMAIRMSVFERLMRPYFRVGVNEEMLECGLGHAAGEDIGFCRAVRAAGFRVHMARGVGADHYKTVSLLSVFRLPQETHGR